MSMARIVRNRLLPAAVFAVVLASAPVRAHAVSKEIVQLQTQVQQLLDMVQRLQSTMDSRFGSLQNLFQQTADQTKAMNAAVNDLQQKLNSQGDNVSGKVDTVSGQVQSLNDSVDELKTRIAKLDKTIQDMQSQLQNIQNPPTAQPGAAPSGAPGGSGGFPPTGAQQPGMPSNPSGPGMTSGAPPANQAPPLQETYQSALRDFNAGRYPLATSEFQDVIHYYPLDDLAGSAQFYLGEIAYEQKSYDTAINAYNVVIENFSGSAKAPAAELHKGLALLATNKKDAGVHELRTLIQRHPRTPEAASARSKLNGMGIRITPK